MDFGNCSYPALVGNTGRLEKNYDSSAHPPGKGSRSIAVYIVAGRDGVYLQYPVRACGSDCLSRHGFVFPNHLHGNRSIVSHPGG